MASVAASMATAKFNHLRMTRIIKESRSLEKDGLITIKPYEKDILEMKLAEFDARVFTIPNSIEVENYFIWRQADAIRNSISSVARSLYSHRELNGKNTNLLLEMISQKGINWNDYASKYKQGRFIFKKEYDVEADENFPAHKRTRWVAGECPIFTQDREFLSNYKPQND
jgi:tRNA(His) 5'-end guanylyltransferase